jgi:serine/threonine-protein kinase RsbW
MGKQHSLTLPGRYGEIKRLCEFVGKGAAHSGFDEDAIFQIQLACDEACTNIVEHTYQEQDKGDITVNWEVQGSKFIVTIVDSGEQFDPDTIPPPSIPRPALHVDDDLDVEVGGLGVHFMRELMDKVSYSYRKGQGNVVTMVRQIPEKKR